MRVDVTTVLVSAALSAIVSAVVALSLTTYRAGREAQAARRVRARQALETEATAMRSTLRSYRAGYADNQHREQSTAHIDDYVKVSGLLTLAAHLSPLRSWLVHRRCRLLFGEHWTRLAEVHPADPASPGSLMAAPLIAAARSARRGEPTASGLDGLLHRAYSERPGHRLQSRLQRQLAMLSRAL